MGRNQKFSWVFWTTVAIGFAWTLGVANAEAFEFLYHIDSRYDLLAMSSEIVDETTELPTTESTEPTESSDLYYSSSNPTDPSVMNSMEDSNSSTTTSDSIVVFDEDKINDESSEYISNENITISESDGSFMDQYKFISCFPLLRSTDNLTESNETLKADICKERGCEWYSKTVNGNYKSYCYTPQHYGYLMEDEPLLYEKGYIVRLVKAGNLTYFGNDSESLVITFEFQSDDRVHFRIVDGNLYGEIPTTSSKLSHSTNSSNRLYDIQFQNEPVFSFKIIRKSTGSVVFDTSLGGLTFSNHLIQIATTLSSHNLYGFSEESGTFSFKQSLESFAKAKVIPIFTKDENELSDSREPGSGANPYYAVVEPEGYFHSVIILHSNARGYSEVQLLPLPGFIYRSTGGVGTLDFYIFMGLQAPV